MSYKGLIALAFGTLGLGIAEFVAMGLLPYWAADFNISLSQSGHNISSAETPVFRQGRKRPPF